MRVAGYARISFDDDGTAAGVTRQTEDIAALVKRKGWALADMYVDNNVSAYKNVVRPEFERLLADLETGVVDGVAVWDCDRLARKPKDLERLIDLYDQRPLAFATCQADIDLSTPDGRFLARLMVSFASKSSSDTARRVARAQLQRAQSGGLSGGGAKPYGYQSDHRSIDPAQAAVLREAAQRIMDGDTLIGICRDFDSRGIPTPGKSLKWNRTVLRSMLLSPRNAGLRAYKGALLMGDDGEPVKASWEPVLDMETWEAVTAVLTDTSRQANGGRVDRKYLLSGFLACPCSARMTGAFSKGAPEYRCPTDRGCGRTRRKANPIDAHVEKAVLQYLERQELTDHSEDVLDMGVDNSIQEAEKSLSNLIDEWTAGRISDSVFFTAQARKEAVLNELKAQRSQEKRRQTMKAPVGAGVRDAWAMTTLPQKRAILREVIQAVKVFPKPVTAAKRFDPKYYEILWN
ncbi:Site-specific DNA recombinase [Arthrobacter sp. ok909]|uniref:recombinase family protein n=1 Tax=Arthrobacter sp. ok909 TaxID=1761746 RepID=UPI00088EDC62|nr:recombinase family protein [Arthrobacter sp. ok909]SDP32750.1 Site-specific DNA recombinase [Arthrobacter sp. ok909]